MTLESLFRFDIQPVPGLIGAFVSKDGAVYSCDRKAANVLNPRKPYLGKVGYYSVTFRGVNSRNAPRYIHRMVAEAFLPPRAESHEVRHLDGNRLNNNVSNLAWGTRSENVEDMRRHGTMLVGDKAFGAKLSEEKVRMIRCLLDGGFSAYSIALLFGVEWSTIKSIKTGRTWGHVVDNDSLDDVASGS